MGHRIALFRRSDTCLFNISCQANTLTKINTNINAQLAANSIAGNSREMEKSVAKLATGSRRNSSRSDPAGSTIAVSMSAKIQGAQMGMRNAIDAISMIHTIEASGQNILDIMIRMRGLGVQAASGTLDFPGFVRHFLASKNSLFHIVLGIYRLCDYDALSDCRTSR